MPRQIFTTRPECFACLNDNRDELLQLPCPIYHLSCKDCTRTLFENAVKREADYPPRCCNFGGELIVQNFRSAITPAIEYQYRRKVEEYSIPASERRYCANPRCSTLFLPHSSTTLLEQFIHCDYCNANTCHYCLEAVMSAALEQHVFLCGRSPETLAFREYAESANVKRCPRCSIAIELSEACNHMFCPCGFQFCFICLLKWPGFHGCPMYGLPRIDDEGYNQDGYHAVTGLDRQGRDREQAQFEDGEEAYYSDTSDEEDAEEEEDEEEEEEEEAQEEEAQEEEQARLGQPQEPRGIENMDFIPSDALTRLQDGSIGLRNDVFFEGLDNQNGLLAVRQLIARNPDWHGAWQRYFAAVPWEIRVIRGFPVPYTTSFDLFFGHIHMWEEFTRRLQNGSLD